MTDETIRAGNDVRFEVPNDGGRELSGKIVTVHAGWCHITALDRNVLGDLGTRNFSVPFSNIRIN
jgi:hypothetical protein